MSRSALSRDAGLYDLVVGGKGSPLQLVLSSVYHLDSPTGNLPYSDFERLRRDSRVLWVAPVGLGDNFSGYRIVGTEPQFFDLPDRNGKAFFTFAKGKVFEDRFGVVLGSQVAASTGLGLGDTFSGLMDLSKFPERKSIVTFPIV